MSSHLPQELAEKMQKAIIEGNAEEADALAMRALNMKVPPARIIDEGFVPGLKRMGELFEAGDAYLPELMLAGEAMKAAVRVLGPALKAAGKGKSTRPVIILGTVEGDIHEIGKNIVGIMLETAGYEVVDLGQDVKADDFVRAARERGAVVIGASALLTTTMEKQRDVVQLARNTNLKVWIIVGGAPVTSGWAETIGADGYAATAKDAVDLVERLLSLGRKP